MRLKSIFLAVFFAAFFLFGFSSSAENPDKNTVPDDPVQETTTRRDPKKSVEITPFPPPIPPEFWNAEPLAAAPNAETCGDGIVQLKLKEECDDGNLKSGDGCSDLCRLEGADCGDGVVRQGEQCEDGNLRDGDGCSATCQNEQAARCGDGILQTGEACDDGNTDENDGCDNACRRQSVCGNLILERGEQCDDGNRLSGDGCSNLCRREAGCGDGILQPGEQCDDANRQAGDGCSAQCTREVSLCGNGTVDRNEQCDDGNTQNGDGCTGTCLIEIPDKDTSCCNSSADCPLPPSQGPELRENDCVCPTQECAPSNLCPAATGICQAGPPRGGCWTDTRSFTVPGTVNVFGVVASSCMAQCTVERRMCGPDAAPTQAVVDRRLTGGTYTLGLGGGTITCDCVTGQLVSGADAGEDCSQASFSEIQCQGV